MEVNYVIVIPVALVVLLLVGWLIRRNSKDRKKFEQESINAEIKPETHKDDHV
ncbi:hypothetical protein [Pedobacter deserti]|uniref:hypothetical protein n=1 Tax=Pedobacter deserti TaxID=2817382 RepID=UPI0021089447|nr:hypothetical protein [Pedobacter sp. SYSU D00382]